MVIESGNRPGLYFANIQFEFNDTECSCRVEAQCVSIVGATHVELYVSSLGDEVLTIPDKVRHTLERIVLLYYVCECGR